MARATVSIAKRMTYENLGISPDVYGTLQTNKRYKSEYVDDALVSADIITVMFLLKNKQYSLMQEIESSTTIAVSGLDLPAHWVIVDVRVTDGTTETGKEISYGTFKEWSINGGTIYDTNYLTHFYALKDNLVFFFGDQVEVDYIDLTHSNPLATFKSPAGFEFAIASLASALLLEKRNDNPEQAAFYRGVYENFMAGYALPDSNRQKEVDS